MWVEVFVTKPKAQPFNQHQQITSVYLTHDDTIIHIRTLCIKLAIIHQLPAQNLHFCLDQIRQFFNSINYNLQNKPQLLASHSLASRTNNPHKTRNEQWISELANISFALNGQSFTWQSLHTQSPQMDPAGQYRASARPVSSNHKQRAARDLARGGKLSIFLPFPILTIIIKYKQPMDYGHMNVNGGKKPDKRPLGTDETGCDLNHGKYGDLSGHDRLEIHKRFKSADSESTGENYTSNKNDLPQQHSSFRFLGHDSNRDLEKQQAEPLIPVLPNKRPAESGNSVTVFNYEAEKTSYNIKISSRASKVQKHRKSEHGQSKIELVNGEEHRESTEMSKSVAPVVREQQGSKKKIIDSSKVHVHFPENQYSEAKPDEANQFKLPVFFNNDQPAFNRDSSESNSEEESFEFELPKDNPDKSKEKLKASCSKSNQGQHMFAFQRILQASPLYRNYLKKESILKKPSLNVLEVSMSKPENLPKQFYFKPERIVFSRPNYDLANDYSYNGYHMICKISEDRTRFYYQDLKFQQLYNMDGVKSSEIPFDRQLGVSRNVEYDHLNKRFYLFSNSQQKILVYSETTQERLCEVKVQKKVNDPHLFIHHANNRTFLLIIGGYCKIQKDIVQGSKFIEIFELMRWEIQLKSKVINLITGRISPIILKITEKDENKILILGGNTIARISKKGKLDYDYQKDMNESTNLTGLSISSHEILQLFDIKQQAICYNHSVKLLNPLSLHDGCLVSVKGMFLLLLPGSKYLFQVKVFNKEVNIIEGKKCNYLVEKQEFEQRQFCIRALQEFIIFYTINEQGLLQILSPESEIQSKCICIIY